MGERELEIDTDVHLMLEKDYIRVILNRILLNGFDLTWFINLFKNRESDIINLVYLLS